MQLSEAIGQYALWRGLKIRPKTLLGDDMNLRHFCIFAKDPKLIDVKISDIIEFLNLARKMGFEENTILKKAIALKKFFEYWVAQGLSGLSVALIPVPRRQFVLPHIADNNGFQKLLDVIGDRIWDVRNRAMILMQGQSGARIGEILAIDVCHLNEDLLGAEIKTEKSRGRRPFRRIYWKQEAKNALDIWLEKRQNLLGNRRMDALFICVKGGSPKAEKFKRLELQGATEVYRKYSVRAGIPTLNSHSLRHKLGRDLAMRGANNATISSILGHANLASSYYYTELFGDDVKRQFEKYT
jgi:site-specific recombinase XerD